MKIITLPQLKDVTVVQQQTVETTTVNLQYIIDDPNKKIIAAFLTVGKSPVFRVDLWTDTDYDSIGNWSQEQADARVIELL